MVDTYSYSKKEEIANAITHGIGSLLSVAALTILIVFASLYGTVWHVVSFSIFGGTMLLLYLSSTLVHSFPSGKLKDLFEIFDHTSIYLFIAGTYTPFTLTVLKGPLGWTLFGTVWGIALVGAVFKSFFTKKFVFLSTIFYIAMGWIIVIAWKPLTEALPFGGTLLLFLGGISYTFGTLFYVWRGFKYHHMVWHLFVLFGSAFHFFAVLFYVLPW